MKVDQAGTSWLIMSEDKNTEILDVEMMKRHFKSVLDDNGQKILADNPLTLFGIFANMQKEIPEQEEQAKDPARRNRRTQEARRSKSRQ
jgi:hypothetical protein